MSAMKSETEISKNYAQALFEVAQKESNFEEYSKQLTSVIETIKTSHDLEVVLSNSSISSVKKIDIINSIFTQKISNNLLNFLKILIEKGRLGELEAIHQGFLRMVNMRLNKKVVEIVSPIELSFENKSNILFKLEKKLKSEISPIWTVKEDIIAGLVFKFDDYVVDTSLVAKLKNLGKVINR